MSRFTKFVLFIIGIITILYLFTCMTFLPFYHSNKTINHDEMVAFILEEVTYEMIYGDKNVDIDLFVDNTIIEALRNN